MPAWFKPHPRGPFAVDAASLFKLRSVEERILKIARLAPGEPFKEVHVLAVTVDPSIEGFFLRLHEKLDEPSMAEYWFETMDLIDRQARTLFGSRFGQWQEPSG
jgi:hypothetical protein